MGVKKGILVHPDEFTKKQIDRAASLGVDVIGIHPVGGKEAAGSLSALVGLCKTGEFRALVDYAIDVCGLTVEYECHAASYLLDRGLFDAHPEYFRMDENGERTPDANFCPSSAEALRIVAERAVALAESLYRGSHDFYFWLDDVSGKKCCCEKCRELSHSDQQMIYLKAIGEALGKRFYDARVPYLAYFNTVELPEKFKPDGRIFLEYAPFEKYVKKHPEMIGREAEMLDPLLDFFGRDGAKVLEYWLDNSLFSGWKKPPKPLVVDRGTVAREVAYYKAHGVKNIATFACFLGDDYEALHGEPDIAAFAASEASPSAK